MSTHSVTGVILAGGQSRRFGSDKALFKLEGISMIQRTYQTLSQVADPLFVSVSGPQTHYPVPARHVYDTKDFAGPLAGIYAALQETNTPWVLVVPVDMPNINPSCLNQVLASRKPEIDAVLAQAEGRPQFLCACYHRRTLPLAKKLLDERQLAVSGFVRHLRVSYVDLPPKVLTNMNTLPDYPGAR